MHDVHQEIERPGTLSSVERPFIDWLQESARSAYDHVKSTVENPYIEAGAVATAGVVVAAVFNREAFAGAAEKFLPKAADLITHSEPSIASIRIASTEIAARDLSVPTGTRLGADGLPRQLPGARQLKLDAPEPLSAHMSADQLHELSRELPAQDDLH